MFNEKELEKIKNDALENHIPIIMDDTLEVIEKKLKEINPKKILEIGTAVGYSASCFAKVTNEDCIIDTIELDEERFKIAKENVKKIGIENRINIINGNAVDVLPTLSAGYDVIFIDANKGKYPVFLQEGIRLINNKGIIFADNVLYKGYVMSDYNKHKQRTAVNHLREFLSKIQNDKNLKSEVLDIGDGLAIIRFNK